MPDYYVLNGSDYTKVSIDDIVKANQSVLAFEKDVQTIKDAAAKEKQDLETKLASLATEADQLRAGKLTAESALSEMKEKELKPLQEKAEKFDALDTEVTSLREKVTAAETQALSSRRNNLITKFNLTGDAKTKVEAMNADQLTVAEESVSLFGINPSQQPPERKNPIPNPDRNSGNNGNKNWDMSSAHDDLRDGLKDLRVASGSD